MLWIIANIRGIVFGVRKIGQLNCINKQNQNLPLKMADVFFGRPPYCGLNWFCSFPHRLLDLKNGKHIDCEVLCILVKAIDENLLDNYERPSKSFKKAALALFGRITAENNGESRVWHLYSQLVTGKFISMNFIFPTKKKCLSLFEQKMWQRKDLRFDSFSQNCLFKQHQR